MARRNLSPNREQAPAAAPSPGSTRAPVMRPGRLTLPARLTPPVRLTLPVLLPLLLALLGAWALARPAAPAHAAAPLRPAPAAPAQQAGLTLEMTVGLTNDCSAGNEIAVQVGTKVYVCYQATNTSSGAGAPTFTSHFLADANAVPFAGPFTDTVAPGASLRKEEEFVVSATTTRNDIWVATDGTTQVQASDSVTLNAEDPSAMVGLTVGRDAATCAADATVLAPNATPLSFCITIVNTGDTTLTTHTIRLPTMSISNTISATLPPDDVLRITAANAASYGLPTLTMASLTATLTPQLSVVSSTANGFLAPSATASATLTLGKPTTSLVTNPSLTESCPAATQVTLAVVVNAPIYHCLRLTNSGNVILTQHSITLASPAKSAVLNLPLAVGATLVISNGTLVGRGLPAILGPIAASTALTSTYTVVSAAAGGFQSSSTSSAKVTVSTPTNTPVNTATASPTVATNTPLPTWTPWPTLSPTPSWTPSMTPVPPTPTNTPSWALSNLATPTPRPPGFDPNLQPMPTDPFGMTNPGFANSPLATPDFNATLLAQQTLDAAFAGQSPLETPAFVSPLATPGAPFAPPDPAAEAAAALAAAQAATQTAAQAVAATLTAAPSATPTPTPTPTVRPLSLPAMPNAGAAAGIFGEVLRSTAAAAGLIFFVLGVMIFFGVAGLVAGSAFRWGERNRYRLYESQPGDGDAPAEPSTRRAADDNWPASLP